MFKSFDKLKQNFGERLGTSRRTEYSDEFLALERDIDTKKDIVVKMHAIASLYIKALTKRDSDKTPVLEALGITMRTGGGSFGADHVYGQALTALGAGLIKASMAQFDYCVELQQTFYGNLERAQADIKEYEASRKKLDSRRIDYDSKLNKLNSSKKESADLEETARLAENKFQDALTECERKMQTVAELEDVLVADLAGFVHAQVTYHTAAMEAMSRVEEQLAELGLRPQKSTSLRRTPTVHSTMNSDDEDDASSVMTRRTASSSWSTTAPPATKQPASHQAMTTASTMLSRAATTASTTTSAVSSKISRAPPPVPPSRTPSIASQPTRKVCRATFDYEAGDSDEISLNKNEIVTIIEEIDEGWWVGETNDGRRGMFPANYVEEIVQPAPTPVKPAPPRLPIRQESAHIPRHVQTPLPSSLSTRQSPAASTAPSLPTHMRQLPGALSNRASAPPPPRPSSVTPPTGGEHHAKNSSGTALQHAATYAARNPQQALALASMAGSAAASSGSASQTIAVSCHECGCDDYQANVFRKGICNNCFHKH